MQPVGSFGYGRRQHDGVAYIVPSELNTFILLHVGLFVSQTDPSPVAFSRELLLLLLVLDE